MSNPYSGRPWLKHYDAHVPANLTYPWVSFVDMAKKCFKEVPDRAAMIYIDTVITFKELDSMSNRFASFLLEKGIKQGDVVGLNMPNMPAFPHLLRWSAENRMHHNRRQSPAHRNRIGASTQRLGS